jgi:hypothetical protein
MLPVAKAWHAVMEALLPLKAFRQVLDFTKFPVLVTPAGFQSSTAVE